jgi:alkylhydroperoxidase family enzyme
MLDTRKMEEVRAAILGTKGETSSELRKSIEARAAGESAELPDALAGYVEKVARHAYRITDEDTQGLERAGYSQDAIFEITLSAAIGAGRARLQRGLAVLKESGR